MNEYSIEDVPQILANMERNLRVLVAVNMAAGNVGKEELEAALKILAEMDSGA